MRKIAALLGALGCLLGATGLGAGPAGASVSHALIQGSGSSWAANAVSQWIADVQNNGLQVVFTPSGSAQGRKDFASRTVDFAVSDIGFQGTDPTTQQDDTSQGRQYAYLPIVAGGTALPYQLKINGQQVRNLRLSGATIAKIFTNRIQYWDDPDIQKDNNNRSDLPHTQIIPVVHSEGSGSTYQFTRYLWKEFPQYWNSFGGNYATEYFPRQGAQVAENGSDSVMNFVTSDSDNGAIGYDEYSYALSNKNFPVIKVLNSAGYYTLPTQYNVAVALTKAVINTNKSSPDYLLQNLDRVYTYSDPRVYPMSSYSYAVIPTSSNANNSKMTTAKRQTLADYLTVSICQGQSQMGPIGYSPLPVNLVQASFDQVRKLKSADPKVDLTNATVNSCHNPTFIAGRPNDNCLAKIAPPPPPCDRAGTGPCAGNVSQKPKGKCVNLDAVSGAGTGNGHLPAGNQSGGGGNPAGGPTGTSGTSGPGVGTVVSGGAPGAVSGANSLTGQGGSGGTGNANGAQAAAQATELKQPQSASSDVVLEVLAAALLLGLLVGPPLVAQRMKTK
jgi:phosphate transport system substrate-binding protein